MIFSVNFVEIDEIITMGIYENDCPLEMLFSGDEEILNFEFSEVHEITILPDDIESYEGSYSVTPQVEQQILDTELKYMKDDLTVKAIPYYATSNLSGGETIYIGSEVD